MSAVLQVSDLKKSYKIGFIPKRQQVLHGVSFSVTPGKVTGFLGGNGAGKTTTMKCFLGLAYPDSGSIRYFNDQPLNDAVKARIGFLPERPYFYEYLTGAEFLKFYGRLAGRQTIKDLNLRIEALLKRVDLWSARDKRLRSYSKGMLQKIGIAQALVHNPDLVVLDEPMSGLDPDGRYYLAEFIRDTAKEGKSVFFSSHLLPDAERLCEELIILRQGVVVYQGSTESFLKKMGDASVINFFLDGQKKSLRVETAEALQTALEKLVREKATIVDVRTDRNLEEAFIKIGLRGEGTGVQP